jgi:hypothetical protein
VLPYSINLLSLLWRCNSIAQEEVRLKVMKSNTTTPYCPAFMVARNNETRDYFNCGENGHVSCDCRAPHMTNRGRERK